jgi:hypothetical protein
MTMIWVKRSSLSTVSSPADGLAAPQRRALARSSRPQGVGYAGESIALIGAHGAGDPMPVALGKTTVADMRAQKAASVRKHRENQSALRSADSPPRGPGRAEDGRRAFEDCFGEIPRSSSDGELDALGAFNFLGPVLALSVFASNCGLALGAERRSNGSSANFAHLIFVSADLAPFLGRSSLKLRGTVPRGPSERACCT